MESPLGKDENTYGKKNISLYQFHETIVFNFLSDKKHVGKLCDKSI